MEKKIDPGTIFRQLKVIERTDEKRHSCYMYKCICLRCGNEILVRSDELRKGKTASCGCLHNELLAENAKKAYHKNFVDGTSIPKLKARNLQNNNTSGYRGVTWHKARCKWYASIQFKGKSYSLGYYDDPKLASDAYNAAKKELHQKYLEDLTNESKENLKKKGENRIEKR